MLRHLFLLAAALPTGASAATVARLPCFAHLDVASSWANALHAYRTGQPVAFYFHEHFPTAPTRPRTVTGIVRAFVEIDGRPAIVVREDFGTVTVDRNSLRSLAIQKRHPVTAVPEVLEVLRTARKQRQLVTLRERGTTQVFANAQITAIFRSVLHDSYLVDFVCGGVTRRRYAEDLLIGQ